MLNICLCDAEAGYLHTPECPYPLYGGTMDECQRWYLAVENKRLSNAAKVVRHAVANADGISRVDVQRRIVGLQFGDDSAAINERLSDVH